MKNDLIHRKDFKTLIEMISMTCKKEGNSISLAVCDKEGQECYVSIESKNEDVAFMVANQLFDFCKETADGAGISVDEASKSIFVEFVTYFNTLTRTEREQRKLLDNPVGRG